MVKIPESYGTVAKMNAQTQIAMPDNGSQMTAQTMQQVGGNLMNMAIQAEYINQKEQEAFKASQLIDFKTELSRFENQQRVALTELPANDAKAIQTAKNKFITERQKFVDDYSNKYKDNKQVSDLLKRQANAESVDFEYDVGRVISSKMKEYGQNTIYKSIYDINNRLSSGGNIEKLSQQLKETLNTGFNAGLIDQQDIIRETEKQKSIIVELQKQYEKTRMANLVADGKMAINPLDSDERKLGDLAFQNVIQKTSGAYLITFFCPISVVANSFFIWFLANSIEPSIVAFLLLTNWSLTICSKVVFNPSSITGFLENNGL